MDVTIDHLAYGGDGVARLPDGAAVFVPYGLPGDRVRVRLAPPNGARAFAHIVDVVNPGASHARPSCPHFYACGGCALQHMNLHAYQAWKVSSVMDRITQAGLRPQNVHPLVAIPAGTRRRATFCARRVGQKILFGFNRHHSAEVIDVATCGVLVPEMEAAIPALRALMGGLLLDVRQADVSVTVLDTGLDILITGLPDLNLLMREALGEFVAAQNVARISVRAHDRVEPEMVLQPRAPLLSVGGQSLTPPPGSFLQPSAAGEDALIAAVRAGVGDAQQVIDLFAGLGTFTWPLAKAARVHAVDADGPSIRVVADLGRGGGGRVTAQARNLYKDPVRAADLQKYDAIVFDPPRAGAKGQGAEIAESGVRRVVAVSCNPTTFVLDAAHLIRAGYTFTDLTIVDQFIWSSHVEIVGVFKR